MRPLEILLLLVLLAGVVAGVVPAFRAAWPARLVPLAVALATAAQTLAEGARWQMAPAYALALTMVLFSRRDLRDGRGDWRRRLAEAAVSGLFVLALALSAALPVTVFDRHLQGASASRLAWPPALYPEAIFKRR